MGKKNRTLMIVDDEVRIGKLIRSLIQWEELQLECAAWDAEDFDALIRGVLRTLGW